MTQEGRETVFLTLVLCFRLRHRGWSGCVADLQTGAGGAGGDTVWPLPRYVFVLEFAKETGSQVYVIWIVKREQWGFVGVNEAV